MVKYYDQAAGRWGGKVRDTESDAAGIVSAALGDGSRRHMVEYLSARGECTVTELSQPVRLTLPATLKQIRILEKGGIIVCRKEGRARKCALNRDALRPLADWAARHGFFWHTSFNRLEKIITNVKKK